MAMAIGKNQSAKRDQNTLEAKAQQINLVGGWGPCFAVIGSKVGAGNYGKTLKL